MVFGMKHHLAINMKNIKKNIKKAYKNAINIPNLIGHNSLLICNEVGKLCFFIYKTIYGILTKVYIKNTCIQFIDIFFFSILLISITGFFSGAVLSLQSYNGLQRFGASSSVPAIVVLSLARELGPVLTALMVTSRVGSRITAEIGGMAITSQIVAMRFLGVSPTRFLVAPRLIAITIATPILSFLFTVMGSIGGYIVCTHLFNFDPAQTIYTALDVLERHDFFVGTTKATFFGFIIGSISSYLGYNTKDGATGLGMTTTNSVVISSMLILLSNYILTNIMFS